MPTRDIIHRYFDKLISGSDWQSLLADDAAFTSYASPIKEAKGKAAFLAATKRFYSSIASAELRELLVDGERACALTRYVIKPPNGAPSFASNVAEIFTVRNNTVKSLEIYFDTAPYPKT
jgi:ketosteroid isomerase-like protein